MTENKRYSFNWERGRPNFWDNHCDLADCYLTCEDVCERLNELDKENRKLKNELNLSKLNLKEKNEGFDKIHKMYMDQIEENKELKEEISIINELLNEYYTADTSETLTHKLKCLLTELKYFRKASNTLEWQSYKEKEFEGF